MNLFRKSFFSLVLIAVAGTVNAAGVKTEIVKSPSGNVEVIVCVGEELTYSVKVDGQDVLVDCAPKMNVKGELKNNKNEVWTLGLNPQLKKVVRETIDVTTAPAVHLKNKEVRDHCNLLRLVMKDGYAVEFRAYDNGAAYRFVTAIKGRLEVIDEDAALRFATDATLTVSPTSNFLTSCEVPFKTLKSTEYNGSVGMMYLPFYANTDNGYHLLFSESDLTDYPGMFLIGDGSGDLHSLFPHPATKKEPLGDRQYKYVEEAPFIAATDGARNFPWRFFVISKDARDIVANEMEYCLAQDCKIEDTSWIRPGQVAWDWWNGRTAFGVDFQAGCNQETYKYFIDFAAEYNIPYIILDEGWARSTHDGRHTSDVINMPELIKYGKEKGVDLILWLTWTCVDDDPGLFELYEQWGVAGVKIDFMDRQDQDMVNYYERTVKRAAEHHLLVDFHGAYKPSGLERMYPNLLSYEGVLGLEQGRRCVPKNSNWLPFIRNAVGAMDFTPGSMLSVQPERHRGDADLSMGCGTRCYQMALYVVFTSGIQMLSDSPTLYRMWPDCTEYIASVPVVWDETRVLEAVPGEYVLVARRYKDSWYIAGINNDTPRDVQIDFSMLVDGTHSMKIFTDGINAHRTAIDYKASTLSIQKSDKITVKMARNGGFAAVVK